MKRKLFAAVLSSLITITTVFGGSATAFAASYQASEKSKSELASNILTSIYNDLQFGEKEMNALATNTIPAELYIYITAQNLLIDSVNNDTMSVTVNYNSNNYSYWTHSDSSVVSAYTVNDTVTNSTTKTFTGTFTLTSSQATVYNGDITAIRLRAKTIGNDLHLYSAPTPTISNLLIGATDATSLASIYINITSKIPGDIDCNGYINQADCDLLSRFIAEDPTVSVTPAGMASADVDRNGLVNSNDLTKILLVLAGTSGNDHF